MKNSFWSGVKNSIAGLGLAGLIAFNAGCGRLPVDPIVVVESIPSQAELGDVVKDIEETKASCSKGVNAQGCDIEGYVSSIARLAGYVMAQEGVDITGVEIKYGDLGYLNYDNIVKGEWGHYFSGDDSIWIRTYYPDERHINSPYLLIRTLFHEFGHREHHVKKDFKVRGNECVSEFFEEYFNTLSKKMIKGKRMPVPYSYFYDELQQPDRITNVILSSEPFDYSNLKYTMYLAGKYLQYKYFGEEGDFDRTVGRLVDYEDLDSTINELEADSDRKTICYHIREGINAYTDMLYPTDKDHDWVLACARDD